MSQPTRVRLSKLKLFYLIFLPVSALSFAYLRQETHNQLTTLNAKKEEAILLREQLELERDYLKHNIELLSNDDYFKLYAKRKLLYTSDGEVLFVFPDENKDS